MIGVGFTSERVMTLEKMGNRKIIKASQDRIREWVSLLAAVCAVKIKIPPVFIYQEESGDLKDSLIKDISDDTVYFAVTTTDWSNNSIERQWIGKMFDKNTKEKAEQRYWLLIVDWHWSYINFFFLNYSKKYQIIVLILSPHSTHRLQLLGVALFLPFSKVYFKELSDFMMKGLEFVSISQRMFYSFFKLA